MKWKETVKKQELLQTKQKHCDLVDLNENGDVLDKTIASPMSSSKLLSNIMCSYLGLSFTRSNMDNLIVDVLDSNIKKIVEDRICKSN